MNRRIEHPQHQSQHQSQPFGLVAWLEKTRVHLPLKGVECRFHVCGDLVNVELDQVFHQNASQAIDCLYTFPLPAGAAVYRCEMHVNGRCIRARVEEQGRAQAIVREQRAAGRRTALVEMERDNLFTLSLGNLQPGDLVIIRFAYFQTVGRLAEWTSARIPFCPGVRYIPGQPLLRGLRGRGTEDDTDQVPDASRISPPRMDALHPDAAYLSIEGELENPSGTVQDLSSPSHPLLVRDGAQGFTIQLADQLAVPDCDFVVRWSELPREEVQACGWVVKQGAEAFALVRLRAPEVKVPAEDAGQDFYFLVDRSGSMEGLKWEKACQAFRQFLSLLGPRDRAWLTFFETTHSDYAERPFTAAEWKQEAGLERLESFGTTGGTMMLPALKHVLQAVSVHSIERPAVLVLITDGEVGNEAAILDALRPHAGLRVHTFGIDTTVNDALLTRLAEQQRGSSCLLSPSDDIVGAVTRLDARLRPPVLTNIVIEGPWELPAEAPAGVCAEEVALISLKGKADATEVTVWARGADGGERTFRVPLAPRSDPALRLLWAKRHIDHCLRVGKRQKAVALAAHYNVLCEGAAFVAWDEAEKVPVAMREVYQPAMEAARIVGSGRGRGLLGSSAAGASFQKKIGFVDDDIACFHMEARLPREALVRDIVNQATAPTRDAVEKLARWVPTLPSEAQTALAQQDRLARLTWWYARMSDLAAFASVPTDGLLQLLFRWALDVPAEIEARLGKLEALWLQLEPGAVDLEQVWLQTEDWLKQEMASTPAYLKQATQLLRSCARAGFGVR